jgi:hypothetical protein
MTQIDAPLGKYRLQRRLLSMCIDFRHSVTKLDAQNLKIRPRQRILRVDGALPARLTSQTMALPPRRTLS